MAKTVAIIGGGISGLTAGIYALKAGYDTTVFEKNPVAGGECTSWERQGYHIDNCVHFLVGCNKEDALNKIWRDTGVLSDDVKLYREPYFYCMEIDGKKLHLWRDLKKAKDELISVAPEDEKELNLFFDCVKRCECIKPPCEINPADMSMFQLMKMGMSMKSVGKAYKEYGKQTMSEFVSRFKNLYIKALFGNYFNRNFVALTFVTSYAFYSGNTAALPEGGSSGIIARMLQRFKSLGGKINLSSEVIDVIVESGNVGKIKLKNGEYVSSDDYIWAADPYPLFHDMVGIKFMDPNLKYMYDNPEGYVATTGYQASFGIRTDKELGLSEGSVIFPCREYVIAKEKYDFCGMRLYDYDKDLYPENLRVIQCNILQSTYDYDFWADLYNDKECYEREKKRIADDLKERIEEKYPQLRNELILLGTYSPVTFNRWCGAYKGGYMSFNALKGYKSKYVKNTIKGIDNLFLAGQWLQNGGGLPIAAVEGKFAVTAMNKKNN